MLFLAVTAATAWYSAGLPANGAVEMDRNIKNEETRRLASELALRAGTTKTGAITLTLRAEPRMR